MTDQVPEAETELAKPPTEANADLSHGERFFPQENDSKQEAVE